MINPAPHPSRSKSLAGSTRRLPLTALVAASLLAAPAAHAGFDITLNFSDTTTAEQRTYFEQAAVFWESQISGYKSGVTLTGLSINVDVKYIDGVSGTLGYAGPSSTVLRSGTRYATSGGMTFDSADVDSMISRGTFTGVIRHEMGHVLGLGTLWTSNSLYTNGTGQYTGANALAGWRDEYGQSTDTYAPVELDGGSGTIDGHWDEAPGGVTTFVSKYTGDNLDDELMTGWASGAMNLSAVTMGSLIDLGYVQAIPIDASGNYRLSTGRMFTGLTGAQSMSKVTDGLVTLASAGNFTGGTSLQAGRLIVENAAALGTGPVSVEGGTLDVAAVGLTGIGALTLESGAITGTTGAINAASYTVKSGSVSAILAGTGALTKSGGGTVTLSGTNTYTGNTSVLAGTLVLAGGSLGDTAVSVATGAAFGGKGAVGTGSASVSFASGATLLGDTAGALTVNGSVNVAAGARIDLVNAPVAGTEYTILNYTGTGTGLDNFTTTFRGVVNTTTANTVKVTAQASVPVTWKGVSDGNWSASDGRNNFARTSGGAIDNFYQGDAVMFDDTGAQKTITVVGRLQPGSLTVSNTTGTYTLGGSGEIAGTGTLTKSGAGILVISTSNSFTGKTTLSGGVLAIGSDWALGAAPAAAVADHLTLSGGTLRADAHLGLATNRGITVSAASGLNTNGYNVNYAGALAGNGTLTKSGAGTLEFTGASSYTGTLVANAGTVKLSNLSGTGFTNLEVGTDGALLINAGSTSKKTTNITVHGAGAGSPTGLILGTGKNFNFIGQLTLGTAPTQMRAEGAGTAILSTFNAKYVAGGSGSYVSDVSMITVAEAASGSVIDGSVQFGGPRSGVSNNFGQTIQVTAGANTATGDLRIDGVLRQGTSPAGTTFQTMGTGSVALTADSTAFTATTVDVRDTSTLMVTGAGRLGGGTHSGTIHLGKAGATLKWASSANQTLAGNILNSTTTGTVGGKLVMAGSGTLTLSGANTYTGGTTVTSGKLLVNNTGGSGLGATGAVNVTGAGTVLGGSGSYTAGLTTIGAGAILQGGDGTTGTALTLGSGVTLASGSIVRLALGEAGTSSTLARTGGTWTFDATQKFSFLDLGATTGTSYTLITGLAADPVTTSGWTIGNANWAGSFSYSAGNVSLVLTAVPEPATYGLLGAASLATCALVRRRRRERAN